MHESIQLALDSAPFLLKGAIFTLQLSLGGMFLGLLLGFVLALMRLSPALAAVRWLARIYVSFFRGTPLIAQLFMIYYGLPQFGIELDPIPAALIGLSLNTAAYTSETLRAAISSIDKGQWEAAASIGMTPLADPAPGDPAAGGAHRPAAAGQQLHRPGERHLAGRHHSGAGTVPSGAADHLAHAGSVHHVPGGLADLLGDGDRAVRAAKPSGSPR